MNFDARLRQTVVQSIAKLDVCDGARLTSQGHHLMVVSNCEDVEACCDTRIEETDFCCGMSGHQDQSAF